MDPGMLFEIHDNTALTHQPDPRLHACMAT